MLVTGFVTQFLYWEGILPSSNFTVAATLQIAVPALMYLGGALIFTPAAETPLVRHRRFASLFWLYAVSAIVTSVSHIFQFVPATAVHLHSSSVAMITLLLFPACIASVCGWIRVSMLARRIPSSGPRWAAMALAAGAVLAFAEMTAAHAREWNVGIQGLCDPLLLDANTIFATLYNTRITGTVRTFTFAMELGWSSMIVLSPLASFTMLVFALRITRLLWLRPQ